MFHCTQVPAGGISRIENLTAGGYNYISVDLENETDQFELTSTKVCQFMDRKKITYMSVE